VIKLGVTVTERVTLGGLVTFCRHNDSRGSSSGSVLIAQAVRSRALCAVCLSAGKVETAQLKVNAVEQVRSFMLGHGLTVNWVLGGSGA
jgi:hypothetical protein